MRYADAGVNIAVADEAKQRIRHLATRTLPTAFSAASGSFGALIALDTKKFKEPILVSSADGVGTKLKIAMAMDVHSTVGGDLVNHCVTTFSCRVPNRSFPRLSRAWQNGSALVEQPRGWYEPRLPGQAVARSSAANRGNPGFYPPGEYVLRDSLSAPSTQKSSPVKTVKPGDTLLALPSAGLHTNGYSSRASSSLKSQN